MRYKLLISDDEMKICRLIKNLVDWEALNIEVVGMVQDGNTALEEARSKRPDLMITDIRMPGMDGLELIRRVREEEIDTDFIIISGYRQFDYAQQAIRYGVEDYIVKPINERELTRMVARILEKRKKNQSLVEDKEYAESRLRENQKLMQSAYLQQLLSGEREVSEEERMLRFEQHARMSAVLVKPDLDCAKDEFDLYFALLKKISELGDTVFGGEYFQCIHAIKDEGVYFIVNYTDQALLYQKIRLLKRQITVQNGAFFPKFTVSIGIGKPKEEIREIKESIAEAEEAVLGRLFTGGGEILEAEETEEEAAGESIFSHTLRAQLLEKIEVFDSSGIAAIIREIGMRCYQTEGIRGAMVKKICEGILNTYLFGAEIIRQKEDDVQFRRIWKKYFSMCGTCREVFEELSAYLQKDMEALLEQKNRQQFRPIRDAKKYLQEHFKEQVYLDDVARKAGFNPAYFSTLFKKETGQTFSDYLIELRIAGAKSLLTDTDRQIADISEEVGYTDLKYFSRIFKRSTGLTPSEFRKLYHKVR